MAGKRTGFPENFSQRGGRGQGYQKGEGGEEVTIHFLLLPPDDTDFLDFLARKGGECKKRRRESFVFFTTFPPFEIAVLTSLLQPPPPPLLPSTIASLAELSMSKKICSCPVMSTSSSSAPSSTSGVSGLSPGWCAGWKADPPRFTSVSWNRFQIDHLIGVAKTLRIGIIVYYTSPVTTWVNIGVSN